MRRAASLCAMDSTIRAHGLTLQIDDETWAALERLAARRGEIPADVVVHAVEFFLEKQGFIPAWAQKPLDARLARRRPDRRK